MIHAARPHAITMRAAVHIFLVVKDMEAVEPLATVIRSVMEGKSMKQNAEEKLARQL